MSPKLRQTLRQQDKIQHLAKARMIKGEHKYGPYDPRKDKRNLYQEMKEEALDLRNYADMLIMKIEAAERKAQAKRQNSLK